MSNPLLNSYFSTVSSERKSPPKQKKSQAEPPKKLSKAFTRQLAKTLGTTKKKKRKSVAKGKRTTNKSKKKMVDKRAASESDGGASKKHKTAALPSKETDKDGQAYWEISGKRRLQLSEFKGTTMVGVREFYEKDGEALPGKKGISMTIEQFNTMVELLPQIESELEKKGLQVSRPKYDKGTGNAAASEEEDGESGEEESAERSENEDSKGNGADAENDDDE